MMDFLFKRPTWNRRYLIDIFEENKTIDGYFIGMREALEKHKEYF